MRRIAIAMLVAAAPAFGAQGEAVSAAGAHAWDRAARKTIWEIVHKDPGAAPVNVPGSPVAAVNRHFACFASQFFGALQVEVEEQPNGIRVRLQGHHARRAAQSLGLAQDDADAVEAVFDKSWCQVSSTRLGVLSCSLPESRWPRPVLPVQALDRSGQKIGDGTLSVYRFSMESTQRTSAGQPDFQREFIELETSMISETDNGKRAELRIQYHPSDCRAK